MVPERAGELPTISPVVAGKPSQHAYLSASRVVGPPAWGASQVALYFSHAVPPVVGALHRQLESFSSCLSSLRSCMGPGFAPKALCMLCSLPRCSSR